MNAFINATNAPGATVTANGMPALTSSGDAICDLFYDIGSSRNNPNITSTFFRAFAKDKTLAARTLFWARDVRGGAGERQTFRNLMLELEATAPAECKRLLSFIPEYGRWDDLLIFQTAGMKVEAYKLCALGIRSGDGLCAKWMPRKGPVAIELRKVMGMSPKQYRKTLVNLTNVVEQKMCAKEWDKIDFGKLPSIASKQYMSAFHRNASIQYIAYKAALMKGEAKINASAIFPHDVIRGMRYGDAAVGMAQWEALPNFLGDDKIIPMVDVSGSMGCPAGPGITCMEVAVALGLYIADKQQGAYNGMFLTFSQTPELIQLKGNLVVKMSQMMRSKWGMSTNVESAFKLILDLAVKNSVPREDMPKYLLILSDMQFNRCVENPSDSAIGMIRRMYETAGYEMPKIVFWNLNAMYGNKPGMTFDKDVAMVSGFSPAIMKSILKAEKFDPISVVLDVINGERYSGINLD
jgi:hypothetical protein